MNIVKSTVIFLSLATFFCTLAHASSVKKINGDTILTTETGTIKISGKQRTASLGTKGDKGDKGDKGEKGDKGAPGPTGILVIEPNPCIQSDLEGTWVMYVGPYKMPLEIDNAGNATIDGITSNGESLAASYAGTIVINEADTNECVINISLSADVGTDFFQEITGDGVISPEKQIIIGSVLDYQLSATKVMKRVAAK